MTSDPDFDVQHRDCFDSLAAMAEAGGADLIMFSPPYPDARKVEAYGAEFDTSLESYGRLGDAVFAALKPGGVCALNIDGPIRTWRGDAIGSERSLIAFEVAIDWAKRVGFRYVEHCAYARDGTPGSFGPRWRTGWEPVHVFSRPGAKPFFDPDGFTVPASMQRKFEARSRSRSVNGARRKKRVKAATERRMKTMLFCGALSCATIDTDHEAPFSRDLADAYVRCYGPPGGVIGDPFVGSGTVAFAVHRAGDGRTFIGGDLGIRKTHKGKPCGRRWADIVNDGLRQGRLF